MIPCFSLPLQIKKIPMRCGVPTKRLAVQLADRLKPNNNILNIMISKNTSSIWKDTYSVTRSLQSGKHVTEK